MQSAEVGYHWSSHDKQNKKKQKLKEVIFVVSIWKLYRFQFYESKILPLEFSWKK